MKVSKKEGLGFRWLHRSVCQNEARHQWNEETMLFCWLQCGLFFSLICPLSIFKFSINYMRKIWSLWEENMKTISMHLPTSGVTYSSQLFAKPDTLKVESYNTSITVSKCTNPEQTGISPWSCKCPRVTLKHISNPLAPGRKISFCI